MEESNHRIAYAFYSSKKWMYGISERETLEKHSTSVTPEEFDISMKGSIFCPVCTTPLSRSPEDTTVTSNSRTAHFKHKPTYSKIPCRLKSPKKEGLSYKTEEDVAKAIEDESLVIVSSWKNHPPSQDDDIDETGEYNQSAVEDEDGPETEVTIGRHNNKEFKVASRISSVTALCWNFDKNLHRGYHFPDSKNPKLLSQMLFDVNRITDDSSNHQRLFFGEVVDYKRLTKRNIIHVKHEVYGEFRIYTWPHHDERKHIDIGSIGRYVIFHSSLAWEGGNIPRSFVNAWGQYSLLPEKYNKFLLKYKKKT
ncbi:hypothetical protein Q4503_06560 [Colwellia sp. 6_MG-2023]|uniref:hypothetical protein n=1 Tax=Colwellia sp. 6_MG-2023 TaxID=3062676 RepID=UPI0026E407D9|nr:hypothetical protein [Colwellia sp. 6_MG-2023]MDO6487355.1 hypothetical protein [Colwellia sp. 6_MG-2023]